MLFSFSELPRSGGMLTGNFRARHKSESFTLAAHGFTFKDGATVEPVTHAVAGRLAAAYGPDVLFEACDDESLKLGVEGLRERRVAEARVAEVIAAHDKRTPPRPAAVRVPVTTPEATATTEPAPPSDEPAGDPPARPTNMVELDAMSDDDARAVAASLGGTDRRWSAARVRRFVADELGLV